DYYCFSTENSVNHRVLF
nr:immunoglobulin light chain junction region [Macaca mulatta]